MPQTIKQRVTLRQIHDELREIRAFLEAPAPRQYTRINTPWGRPYDDPPLPATPSVHTDAAGSAPGRVRSFYSRCLAFLRGGL